jgi:hypothetical protein
MVTKQEVIERTRSAFAPPTARQLEQQAQARARGGLTDRGRREFESSTPSQQQQRIEKERVAVGLPKEGAPKEQLTPKPTPTTKTIQQKPIQVQAATSKPKATELKQFKSKKQTASPVISTASQTTSAFEQRLQAIKQREQRLESFTTLGGRLSPDLTETGKERFSFANVGRAIARTPLQIAAIPTFIGGRVGLFFEGLTKKESRDVLKESAKEVPKEIKSGFDVTTPTGLINVGLITGGIRAKAIQTQTTTAFKGAPKIRGEQFFGKKQSIAFEKSAKIIETPQKTTTIPKQFTEKTFRVETDVPTVQVARGKIGKADVTTVTVGKRQTQTVSRQLAGKQVSAQTITDITTGRSTTKVLRDSKIISQKTTQFKPDVKFTEQIPGITKKDTFATKKGVAELGSTISGRESVPLKIRGKITEARVKTVTQEQLKVVAKSPEISALTTEARVNFATGTVTPSKVSIDITQPRFKFVDFPTKQKPVVIKRVDGGVLKVQPTAFETAQKLKIKQTFQVGEAPFVVGKRFRSARPKAREPKPTEFSRQLEANIKADVARQQKIVKQVTGRDSTTTKTKTRKQTIQRPKALAPEVKTNIKLSFATPKVSTRTLLGVVSKPKARPSVDVSAKPKTTPITKPKVIPVVKPISKPVQKPVQKPVVKPIVKPITKPIQREIQKRISKQVARQITKTRTPKRAAVFRGMGIARPLTIPKVPKTIAMFLPRVGKTGGLSSKRKFGISTKFNPSLVAAQEKIKGRRPNLLTGLKIRPIEVKY